MTLLDLGMRLVGEIHEIPGAEDSGFIRWCHGATTLGETHDEIPWCSSFINRLAWLLRLPRSKSAMARSWLGVGISIPTEEAMPGWDIVVLSRGSNPQAGHVGLFAGWEDSSAGRVVRLVGGNQSNGVTLAEFPVTRILGVRRLLLGPLPRTDVSGVVIDGP